MLRKLPRRKQSAKRQSGVTNGSSRAYATGSGLLAEEGVVDTAADATLIQIGEEETLDPLQDTGAILKITGHLPDGRLTLTFLQRAADEETSTDGLAHHPPGALGLAHHLASSRDAGLQAYRAVTRGPSLQSHAGGDEHQALQAEAHGGTNPRLQLKDRAHVHLEDAAPPAHPPLLRAADVGHLPCPVRDLDRQARGVTETTGHIVEGAPLLVAATTRGIGAPELQDGATDRQVEVRLEDRHLLLASVVAQWNDGSRGLGVEQANHRRLYADEIRLHQRATRQQGV